MKKLIVLSLGLALYIPLTSYGPPNCYLYEGDCKKACEKAEEAIRYAQGSKQSQERFDESIALCPSFDYSYYEKAVPYAKRGQMMEWKKLIDTAVQIDSLEHLSNRAWNHFFFMNNYTAAIKDMETLIALKGDDEIGETGDAAYHLNILRAICYFLDGHQSKGIEVFLHQMAKESHYVGLYDFLSLGAMQYQMGDYIPALRSFEQQEQHNDLAENHYYKALIYHQQNKIKESIDELTIALNYYRANKHMENGYRELPFEIYESDIVNAIEEIS